MRESPLRLVFLNSAPRVLIYDFTCGSAIRQWLRFSNNERTLNFNGCEELDFKNSAKCLF